MGGLLLRRCSPPGPDDVWSLTPRRALLAVRGVGWEKALVVAWTWNPDGGPVEWRCAVDVGDGQVAWHSYDCRWIRSARPASHRG